MIPPSYRSRNVPSFVLLNFTVYSCTRVDLDLSLTLTNSLTGLIELVCHILHHYAKANYLPVDLVRCLVLTTVLGRPRHADAKNGVKNYQGLTTSRANAIRKYLNFP
jgi:hypothetical protein